MTAEYFAVALFTFLLEYVCLLIALQLIEPWAVSQVVKYFNCLHALDRLSETGEKECTSSLLSDCQKSDKL